MKILVLNELSYPHGSGGELATFLYSKLLADAGNKLIVVTHRFSGEPEYSRDGNIQTLRVPIFGSSGENKYSTLRRSDILLTGYFRKLIEWADVVYIPKFWYAAILLAKAFHKPVVVHSHGFLPICPLSIAYDIFKQEQCANKMPFCSGCIYRYEKMSGRRFLESFGSAILNNAIGSCFSQAIKLSDAIITVSDAQRKMMVKNIPSIQGKVHTVYNPLPDPPYTKIERDDFGYFGGPSIQKGFGILCQALTHYKKTLNSSAITVHSTCFNTTDRESARLRQIGIHAYARVDNKRYNKIYEQIRGVIIPSLWPEVYGYVASEAFLRGRLVIASNIGGLAEITAGFPGAFTFQPGDYRELAEQIKYVRDLTQAQAIDLGAQNRAVILKKYSNSRILKQFMNLLAVAVSM